MTDRENPKVEIQIHIDGVVAPAQQAAAVSKEIVDFYFTALEKTDLSKKPEAAAGKFVGFGFQTI